MLTLLTFVVFGYHLVEHGLELMYLLVDPVVVRGASRRLLLMDARQDLDPLLKESIQACIKVTLDKSWVLFLAFSSVLIWFGALRWA